MPTNELRASRNPSDCFDSTDYPKGSATFTRALGAISCWLILASVSGCASSWGGSIGAVLGQRKSDRHVYVRAVPRDMAGYRGGLREGDELVAIDERPVDRMEAAEVTQALRGRVGTKVNLVVVRGSDRLNITIERGPFKEARK
jgi:hypothetical protein